MRRLVLTVVAVVAGALSPGQAQETVPLEYQVKAAYLYHFTQFVEWPSDASTGALRICVARRNPFGRALQEIASGETVAQRRIEVDVVEQPDASCRVLFVPQGVSAAPFLRAVRDTPVLTVGETQQFLQQGGVANFYREGRNVRFEINRAAADRARLRVSARLLQLARLADGRSG